MGSDGGGGKNLYLFFTLIPITSPVQNPLGVGAIWFLPCLFEIYLLYYALRRITNKKTLLLIFALAFMIVSSLLLQRYAMGSLFYLFDTFQFLIFFAVGHLYRDYWLKDGIPLLIGVLGLLVYMSLYVTAPESWNYFLVFILNKIQMIGLMVFLIVIAKRIHNGIIKRLIIFWGRNSITVLGIHILAMNACKVVLTHIMASSFLYYFIMFILIMTICTICIKIFNRCCPVLVNAK